MAITITKQNSLWKSVLSYIDKKLSKDRHTFDALYSELSLHSIDEEKKEMVITTNSNLCKGFFSKGHENLQLLNEAIKNVTNNSYKLSFFLVEELPTKREKTNNKYTPNQNYFSNCKLNPKYTFDNFVVGSCNKDAVRASLIISENPGETFNPLFIYSKSGLGKTHLLHAVGNYYQEKFPNARVLYITMDAFIDEFVKFVTGSNDNQHFRDFFKSVDLLLVDDIQFLSNKERTGENFFYIFNSLVNNGKQIVLTSDRHPKDLKGLEDRLVSRFNSGLTMTIQPPDTETLYEILKRKITSHGLNVDNYSKDGLMFLAETFSKNVRELEGALNRLLFHTVSIQETDVVTLEDIKEAVNIMIPNSEKKKDLTEEDVIYAVANYYNLTSEQIHSKIRTAQIALSRRIAMYLCRNMLGSSFVRIGEVFQRDHSTVMTGVDKVGKEIKTDNQLASAIQDIKKALKK